ncbi:hypothetical protein AMK59_7585 [Oryctes borbonicus]|uniref:Tr-type G domain-containing protein n=1 Tax=Oryctes borbonicus TaxID=1629725 RepID=A0A0T6AZB9_9SCAR|nr:hypothetical protein AMK59_7585 [Oryctes borbonicus]
MQLFNTLKFETKTMYSMRPNTEESKCCGSNSNYIRNVCILAHVDHGKTTIADSLLAINGIVSKRLAGQIRYLDDRLDEQQRGITMKSSAVSLCFPVSDQKYIINLVDTPGHIDFSTEVAATVRICDGALIVVDVVEGVCVQTKDAIKQAYDEQVKMILVINKIDRLIVELRKTVDEIFKNILRVIEDCNVTIAELCRYDLENEEDEEEYFFSPEKDNVVFASAIDGWGVTTRLICSMFHHIVADETADSLFEKIWNFDYYVDSSTKKVVSGCIEKKKENLFIQLFLKAIYYVYFTLIIRMDREKLEIILQKLKIKNTTNEMRHNDSRVQVKAILQAWSPLASVILNQCINVVPSPDNINSRKIRRLTFCNRYFESDTVNSCCEVMTNGMKNLGNIDHPSIAYVSKMFFVNKKNLSQNKPKIVTPRCRNIEQKKVEEQKPQTEPKSEDHKKEPTTHNSNGESLHQDDPGNVAIGLCRIFSGNLSVGQEIYFLNNSYIPFNNLILDNEDVKKITIKELYLLLGRELILTDSISFGNICGIGGLEDIIIRSGTLSSTLDCLPLTEYAYMEPIVRNTIQPVNPKDFPVLHQALKQLTQSDSCVQVLMQETGEHVLVTAGDVHLAKCLEDLRNKFIKFEINVSKPMVSLRETIINTDKRIDLKDPSGCIEIYAPEFGLQAQVKAVPVCDKVSNFIKLNYDIFRTIEEHKQENFLAPSDTKQKMFQNEYTRHLVSKLNEQLANVFKNSSELWRDFSDRIWSVSKTKNSINLLFNNTDDYKRNIFNVVDQKDERSNFDHCFVNGFEMCCRAGPICEEPLVNCAFFVNKYILDSENSLSEPGVHAVANVTLAIKNGLREAFEKQQQRLMEPIFITDIQVNTFILGKVYSVISKRQGKVLQAIGMDDKEKTFMVTAQIPVIESDGFANEIRKTTSGQANPNLRFSHYEIIDGDPYYEEAVVEDDEDQVNIESAIRANKLMKEVRKRKGLLIDEQVVIHAEKQRTLNKKK